MGRFLIAAGVILLIAGCLTIVLERAGIHLSVEFPGANQTIEYTLKKTS